MAVQIQMAEPADLAGIYLKGVQTRAQIQEANARLAAQQQEATMRAQQESQARAQQAQQYQQEHNLAQQRIQVEHAYQSQEIDLRKQELAQAAQMNEQKTQAAAKQFAARQEVQKGIAAIQANTTLSEEQKASQIQDVLMKGIVTGDVPSESGAAALSNLRRDKATIPTNVPEGKSIRSYNPSTGAVSYETDKAPKDPKDPMVTVVYPDPAIPDGKVYRNVHKSEALQTIPNFPQELQNNSVNKAAMAISAGGSKFQKGKRARQNGMVYEYDGQTWNPVGE
jgi:multidrug efflux pump subunit AcrA (membrane-fusion protein)